MDVLQVNKLYYPVVGGIEEVVRQLATGLPERGVNTHVLVSREFGRGRSEFVDEVPVTRISSMGVILSTPIAPTFPIRLRQLSRDVDIIHYHLPNPLAVASHFLARPSAPVVVTYHSDIVRQVRALWAYRPILHRFLRNADRIVTTSPKLRDKSRILKPHLDKTMVIPLSVDLDTIDSMGKEAVGPMGNDESPTILFVGRLNYYKGIEYLLDAVASIDMPVKLLVVGEGDRRQTLEQLAHSLGIDDEVKFLGAVNESTLHACYAQSSFFVLPSVESSEAFAIVQLEAMAYGLPVINTNLPTGVPWVSLDGETGTTVPPRDSEALAAAIEDLLTDTERRNSYGRAARERVESKFTEEQMIESTIELYHTLIS